MKVIAICLLLLGYNRATRHSIRLPVPDAFRGSLEKVFEQYGIVENALADGQMVLAVNAASVMHARLHEASTDGLDSTAKAYWDTTFSRLMDVLHQPLPPTPDLAAVRKAFAGYSPILADAFIAFELDKRVPIVIFNCAKAAEGKGGLWMQSGFEPVNPYLGRAEKSCAARLDHGGFPR